MTVQQADRPQWVTLARLLRPQGRRGELLAELLTDFPDLFTRAAGLTLIDPRQGRHAVRVDGYWLPVGRNAGRVVLKLEGTDTISQAEALAGYELQMPASERLPLEEDQFYVDDLLGCSLWDGDLRLGMVSEVRFPVDAEGRRQDDAPALFVILREEDEELLVPFANALVHSIDIAAKRIDMALPGGLAALNSGLRA